MSRVDLAELRRLHEAAMQETSTPQDLRRSMNAAYLALPALLDELEESREEIRRLTQANGDLRTERDRAVKEAQRQDGVAKGLRKENLARDRRMKAIGAAEELEKAAAEEWQVASDGGNPILIVGRLQQRAAQLRQEAEGK